MGWVPEGGSKMCSNPCLEFLLCWHSMGLEKCRQTCCIQLSDITICTG